MDLYFIITNEMADKFGLPQDKDGKIGWSISKVSLFSEVVFATISEPNEWIDKNTHAVLHFIDRYTGFCFLPV